MFQGVIAPKLSKIRELTTSVKEPEIKVSVLMKNPLLNEKQAAEEETIDTNKQPKIDSNKIPSLVLEYLSIKLANFNTH